MSGTTFVLLLMIIGGAVGAAWIIWTLLNLKGKR